MRREKRKNFWNWRGGFILLTSLWLALAVCSQAFAFTVSVQDNQGNPVAGFKWLLELDNTNQSPPGALVPDSLAVSIHKSHAPVVKNGASDQDFANILVPDPNERYLLSVQPYAGYTMGGAVVVDDQDVTVIVSEFDIPTSQISILAFIDHDPINNSPDVAGFRGQPLGNEPGLAGVGVLLSDPAGQVTQDAFGNPLGTQYAFNDTNTNGIHDPGETYALLGGEPQVTALGTGVIETGPDGRVTIKHIPPGKYGVVLNPPDGDGKTYWQTTTIEGTPTVDAWIQANNPELLVEFGPAFNHIFIGFVVAEDLPGFRPLEVGEVPASIGGRVVNNHLSRPPELLPNAGHGVPDCLAALNDISGTGAGVAAQACDNNSEFLFTDVPPGLYQLVVWDKALDYIIYFQTVSVPNGGAPVELGNILVNAWFNSLEGTVFYDSDTTGIMGFQDPGEPGLLNQAVLLRFRDGTIYQATASDPNGEYALNEVFPFFHWLVTEVDFANFKATGATIAVDAGGPVMAGFPGDGKMNPQIQDPTDPANENGTTLWRTETGPVLTEAYFGFAGQTNKIYWGKRDYAPGENGGISGIVYAAVTVAEDDPAYTAAEEWEPGIPRVQVNLYQDTDQNDQIDARVGNTSGHSLADVDNYPLGWAEGGVKGDEDIDRNNNGAFDFGDAIQVTWTDSWDDDAPTGCIQPQLTVHGELVEPCFDNFATWNQVRPGVFDGGYAFDGIPTGMYIVEAATPPGYELLSEEHKNVDFGYPWTPSSQALPPACVGDPHLIPDYVRFQTDAAGNSLPGIDPADLIEAPYAGTMRPKCDRKSIYLTSGKNAAVEFMAITPVPKGSRAVGFINNDFGAEQNPFNPNFGEKQSPSWLPISFKNYQGDEVVRVYSDEFGAYNALLPSTYTVNVASPTGVSPMIYTICLNDPGPIADPADPGQMIIDPFYDTNYSNTCYTFNFEPGKTTYLDTPVIQIAAFVGNPNRILDVQVEAGVPVIESVTGPQGGALACAEGDTITLESLGLTEVPNPDFDPTATPPDPNAETLITRDFGFGPDQGTVTLGGVALSITGWTDSTITATIPAGATTGQLNVTRGDNGAMTQTAVTLHIGDCGAAVHVAAGESIQAAIDAAAPGSTIFVDPGIYGENLVIWKNVRLQGSGADSTIINALPVPFDRVTAWKNYVQGLIDGGQMVLLPGQDINTIINVDTAPGILVSGVDATFDMTNPGLIDGFTIRSANSGGGIYVNAYGDYLTISNNKITNNLGNQGGGIHIGNPALASFNNNITVAYNQVLQNGGINGGSGISYFAGTDDLMVYGNRIAGNFTRDNGGAISHNGPSDNVYIGYNDILFNEVFYGEQLGGNGGGIYISGVPAVDGLPTPGAGNVTIEGNLIQGNLAGSASGGGIMVEDFNGTDATYLLKIFDNIIVNNIAATAGGGIFVSNVASDNAKIINNTVAHNDSTATSTAANVAQPQSTPQVAGIAVDNAAPELVNNIVYMNRSFYRDGTQQTVPGSPEFGLGVLVPASLHPSGDYDQDTWDLGVFGTTGIVNPDYSLLTTLNGVMGGVVFNHDDGTNVVGDPLFVSSYATELSTAAAGDEGGNFVNVYPSPLTVGDSDYHIPFESPATDVGTSAAFAELDNDYDGDIRPAGDGVDIGADEFPFVLTALLSPNGGETLFTGNTHMIQWQEGTVAAASYRLHYSIDNGASWQFIADASGGTTSYAWNVPAVASPETDSLVRVSAFSSATPSPGNVINRDVSDAPFTLTSRLMVTAPNGGESLTAGDTFTTSWTPNFNALSHRLHYSIDGGATWMFAADVGAVTSYDWTVPAVAADELDALFRVSAFSSATPGPGAVLARDASNAFFTILAAGPPPFQLMDPNGGEVLTSGQSYLVQWNSHSSAAGYRLHYSIDGGTTWLFAADVGNVASFNWTVPAVAGTEADSMFRVTAFDGGGAVLARDKSNAVFTIQP